MSKNPLNRALPHDFGYPFAMPRTNAYLTPKESRRQMVKDPKPVLRGAHTNWEAVLNSMLGKRGILNDDEYNLMKRKGGY